VRSTPKSFPNALKKKVLFLMKRDPEAWLKQLALAWGTIFGVIAFANRLHSLAFTVFAIFLVATRQNLLLLLMHEQVHWLGFKSKWGDLLCELMTAYPLLISLEGYRRVHLAHHVNYFDEKDPDYRRKQGAEWTFPQQIAFFSQNAFEGFSWPQFFEIREGKVCQRTLCSRSYKFHAFIVVETRLLFGIGCHIDRTAFVAGIPDLLAYAIVHVPSGFCSLGCHLRAQI
jgi:fatty acid desaturase